MLEFLLVPSAKSRLLAGVVLFLKGELTALVIFLILADSVLTLLARMVVFTSVWFSSVSSSIFCVLLLPVVSSSASWIVCTCAGVLLLVLAGLDVLDGVLAVLDLDLVLLLVASPKSTTFTVFIWFFWSLSSSCHMLMIFLVLVLVMVSFSLLWAGVEGVVVFLLVSKLVGGGFGGGLGGRFAHVPYNGGGVLAWLGLVGSVLLGILAKPGMTRLDGVG